MLALFLRSPRRPRRSDLLVGAGLGFFSTCGQNSMGLALANGLPGNVVFPVTLAGGLFLVVLAAIFIFRERIGPAGIAGIASGDYFNRAAEPQLNHLGKVASSAAK